MPENNVIIGLVCHNMDIVKSILSDNSKQHFHILFVGSGEVTVEHPRITVVRNLLNNIEKEKDLLTFTAWYAIIKNDLFLEYEYVCILEYDVQIKPNFETELIKRCNMRTYDVISFIQMNSYFWLDVKENIMNFFLNKKGITLNVPTTWYPTTNHCLKRTHLNDFVDWYYPDCLDIKKMDPTKISWYHERIFTLFTNARSYQTYHLELLSHFFSNSHNYMHHAPTVSSDLIAHYINNPHCEFLQQLLNHYDFFLKLNVDFHVNVGSYLCGGQGYSYTYEVYEKQKLLFQTAKTCKNALLIGNYMGHIAFIMLMANPNINITCIDVQDNYKYIPLLETYFQRNVLFYISNDQNHTISLLKNARHIYDFVHLSQQYPVREYLNTYTDICIQKTKMEKMTFIIDDYNVYSKEIIETIKKNNAHCKLEKELVVNGSNTTLLLSMNVYKKYLLIYDDETEHFKPHIDKLIDSVKQYDDSFIVRVFSKNELDDEFVETNKHILEQSRGGGYWLWKPYIIQKTLQEIKDNDILFYIDARYYFKENFGELFKPLLTQNLLVWRNKPNEPSYYLKNWCKMDVVEKYNIREKVFKENAEACWAGALVMRKTETVTKIIGEWLMMCCSDNDITDEPSSVPNSHEFIEHRHDQSLLSILISKYNIPLQTFEKRFIQNVRCPY